MMRGALVAVALLAVAPRVSAEPNRFEPAEGGLAWGAATLEVAETAMLLLRFSVLRGPMDEGAEGLLLMTPLVLAGGAGVAGWAWCLPARIPLAVHGGVYTGLAAGLATGLVRGALTAGGTLRFQSPEGIAALVGIFPGLLLGALEVDPDDPLGAWLGAPPAGFLGGVLLAGIVAVVGFLAAGDLGPGGTDQLIGWPVFAGLSTGLVVATGSVLE